MSQTSTTQPLRPRGNAWAEESAIQNVPQQERIFSAAAGAVLLLTGIRHPLKHLVSLGLGGYLLYRGASGNCPLTRFFKRSAPEQHTRAVNIRTSIVVNRHRAEVYAFWRRLENLPRFMRHLTDVQSITDTHSVWQIHVPGFEIVWEAEIVRELPNELLSWRSLPDSMIVTAGKVEFLDAPNGGTELRIMITYRPPAGDVGRAVATMLTPAFRHMVQRDIRQFKDLVESVRETV
ncbi:cyclase/dehydrase [Chitinophaga parva]|uniref:Cyclase/dehydrase n=1 Tax=Chitinophaga parva TaxID=2169414 RepID=A0A2T7BDV1_9BACT|nr:SRPBCC family protein [Chitinophaga parva]PUZ23278.1 cyclase/dehydrase [Chitinophaga parva]